MRLQHLCCNLAAIILVVYCYNQLKRIEAIAIIFQLYIKDSVQKCLQHAFWWFAYNLIPHCIGFCRYFAESKETNQSSYLFLLLKNIIVQKSAISYISIVQIYKYDGFCQICQITLFASRTEDLIWSWNFTEIHFSVICLIDKIIQMLHLAAKELCTKIIIPLRQPLHPWQQCSL